MDGKGILHVGFIAFFISRFGGSRNTGSLFSAGSCPNGSPDSGGAATAGGEPNRDQFTRSDGDSRPYSAESGGKLCRNKV